MLNGCFSKIHPFQCYNNDTCLELWIDALRPLLQPSSSLNRSSLQWQLSTRHSENGLNWNYNWVFFIGLTDSSSINNSQQDSLSFRYWLLKLYKKILRYSLYVRKSQSRTASPTWSLPGHLTTKVFTSI